MRKKRSGYVLRIMEYVVTKESHRTVSQIFSNNLIQIQLGLPIPIARNPFQEANHEFKVVELSIAGQPPQT
jgi:hypothetical protein